MRHPRKKQRRRRAQVKETREITRLGKAEAPPSFTDRREAYSDDEILRVARDGCITPGGFVERVQVAPEPLSSQAIARAQTIYPEISVSAPAFFLRETMDAKIAEVIRLSWEPQHYDQVRWAAGLLEGAASATRPDQVTCIVETLASRLVRTARFQGIPNATEICKGAVIVACRLKRIDLWPMGGERETFRMWKVGIHRVFRFPGELAPPKSLVSSMEFYRKRR